jgi:hypothetical protein
MTEVAQTGKSEMAHSWGTGSRFFCGLGGLVAIFAGLSLAFVKAAGENSMLQLIANGMGWYFVGKGLFMMGAAFQLKGAVNHLFSK